LAQLTLLPDTRKRRQEELEFYCDFASVLGIVIGFTAPETGDTLARARERWEQLGCPTEYIHILFLQSLYHSYRGEFDLAQRADEDLLPLSHQRDDSIGLLLGHTSAGLSLLSIGNFASSRSHREAALALYDPVAYGTYPKDNSSPSRAITGFFGERPLLPRFC